MKKGPFKMKRKSPMLEQVLGKKFGKRDKAVKAARTFAQSFKGLNKGSLPPLADGKFVSAASTAGKAARIGSRFLGGFGVGLLLKDFYKSGQKRSGGRISKNQKRILPKTTFDINKGFKVTNKKFKFD
jgi:hypothetical protein